MIDVVLLAVVAVPGVFFVVMWLRAKVFGEIGELGERLGQRAAITRRFPYHRAVCGWGIVCLPMVLVMFVKGFKVQPDMTAHARKA